MLSLLAAAFALGLIFNAAPGAVFAETVRQGMRGGFRPALLVQLGSLAGDAAWAALGLAGVGFLLQLEALRVPIGIAGGVYLLWLAVDAWRAAGVELEREAAGSRPGQKALHAGAVLSLTNPQNVAYWAALGSAMGAVGVSDPTAEHYTVFFAGFMLASVVWAFVCAAIIDRLFRNASARWSRLTYRLCAVAFLALALSTFRELAEPQRPAAAVRQHQQ